MPSRPQVLRWVLRLVKLGVLALLAWTIKGTLTKAFEDLSQHTVHIHWEWLVVAGVFIFLSTLPAAFFWSRLIRAADYRLPRFESYRAFYLSQVGKYVPGKAMVIILRAAVLRSRLPATLVTVTTFFETLTNMAVGCFTALLILLSDAGQRQLLILAALGMLLATGLPAIPAVFKFLLRFSGLGKINAEAVNRIRGIRPQSLVVAWSAMILGWWLQGLGLWAALRALEIPLPNPLMNWPTHTATMALSAAAGFLTLLPAGVGAREWVQIELLKPLYGDTPAVVSAVLLRLVSVFTDVALAGVLYFIRPAGQKAIESDPEPTAEHSAP